MTPQTPLKVLGVLQAAGFPTQTPHSSSRSQHHVAAWALSTLQTQAVYELYEHSKAKAAVATASFYVIWFFPLPPPLNFYDPDTKPWEIQV